MPTTITNHDGLGVAVDHLGSGTCAILNVNAGSKVNPAVAGYFGSTWMHDMCWFGGEIHAVHCEADSTVTGAPWDSNLVQWRGPYVQKLSSGAWTAVGSTLDPGVDTAPSVAGDRFHAHCPRIATDGTDLFVTYYDWVTVDPGQPNGDAVLHIYICHWNGTSWDEVASEPVFGPVLNGSTVSGGTPISITVAGGKAYTIYETGNNNLRVRIFRSDGSADFVDGSGNETIGNGTGGSHAAVTTSGGAPVGFYTKVFSQGSFSPGTAGRIVMFDLDTAAVIQETPTTLGPSALTPYAGPHVVNANMVQLNFQAELYDGGNIIIASQLGPLIVPEGGGDLTTIDGSDGAKLMTGQIAVDASNPREVWGSRKLVDINTGTNNHDMPVYVWDQACSADFAPSTPLNAAPQYSLHDTGWKLPLDGFPNFCLFFSSTGWGIFGPPVFLTDSNYLYAFWVYWPKTDSGDDGSQQYWTQFIVTRWPINRDTITCGTLNTPIFTSRFRGSDD